MTVPYRWKMLYCEQMRKKSKNRCELHLFHDGVHGLSICRKEVGVNNKHVEKWLELCAEWLDEIFA